MTRKKIRENLYIMLFRLDFHDKSDLNAQADMWLEDLQGASANVKSELKEKFNGVIAHLSEIDEMIEAKSKGWTIDRIAKAELTVLRLAVYEILYVDDVPDRVAINEAVELSKVYCADKASGFVNGILASVVREKPADAEEEKKNGEEAKSDGEE